MITLHTNLGDIKIELDFDNTPVTANNFLQYAEAGFYDGTIFHRIIKGFMNQGGGYTADLDKRDTREAIENEADKGGKNVKGTLSMARTSDPHSATAQFFINAVDNSFLDHKSKTDQGWGYCVFGKVIDGMDVVDAMNKVKTGSKFGFNDVPLDDVVIEKVTVENSEK